MNTRTTNDVMNDINVLIQEFWTLSEQHEDCTCENHTMPWYVKGWAIACHMGDLQEDRYVTYQVLNYPKDDSPHAIKGLLNEGIGVIESVQGRS